MKYSDTYSNAGSITFEYNDKGLIIFSKGKDDFANFTLAVKYYSKGKLIR